MKIMILMVTVLFPDLQAYTNAMYALNGALDMETRACDAWKRILREHEDPEIDPSTDEGLRDFIEERKTSCDDSWF